MMNSDKELKLDRLANPRSQYPTFISNITVNNWQIVENKDDESHHLLAFSPEEVKLIGKYVTENGDMIPTDELFNGLFRPKDMRLSSAMAISGAALSFDMGHYENKLDMVLDLLALLGIGMGDEKVCNQKEEEGNGPYYKVCDSHNVPLNESVFYIKDRVLVVVERSKRIHCTVLIMFYMRWRIQIRLGALFKSCLVVSRIFGA